MGQLISRIVPNTVLTKSLTATQQDAAAQDTAVTSAMDAILATPPAGYGPGTLLLGSTTLLFDGTNYIFTTTFTYNTSLVS